MAGYAVFRKHTESVVLTLADGREIVIQNIQPRTTRLLIQAPSDVLIEREEDKGKKRELAESK